MCFNGDGGCGGSSFKGQEDDCLRRLIGEGVSTHRGLDIVPPRAKIHVHRTRDRTLPALLPASSGAVGRTRPRHRCSCAYRGISTVLSRPTIRHQPEMRWISRAKDEMGLAREMYRSHQFRAARECLISRTDREIRTAREKELSLFVSSDASASNPSHHW